MNTSGLYLGGLKTGKKNYMNNVREHIISELSKIDVTNAIIIDWGSGERRRRATRWVKHKDCEIINVDCEPRRSPTIVADICKPLLIKEADIAFCIEVLEHCYNPEVVVENISNNLKKGGKLYISAPFVVSLHGKDYWRFTGLGIKTLLKRHRFKVVKIERSEDSSGNPKIGHFVEAIKT